MTTHTITPSDAPHALNPYAFHNILNALALRLGISTGCVLLSVHRPAFGRPFRTVTIRAESSHATYGMTLHDDDHVTFLVGDSSVDRLPSDEVSRLLMETFRRHRDAARAYLSTQSYEAWHVLGVGVEACSTC